MACSGAVQVPGTLDDMEIALVCYTWKGVLLMKI